MCARLPSTWQSLRHLTCVINVFIRPAAALTSSCPPFCSDIFSRLDSISHKTWRSCRLLLLLLFSGSFHSVSRLITFLSSRIRSHHICFEYIILSMQCHGISNNASSPFSRRARLPTALLLLPPSAPTPQQKLHKFDSACRRRSYEVENKIARQDKKSFSLSLSHLLPQGSTS